VQAGRLGRTGETVTAAFGFGLEQIGQTGDLLLDRREADQAVELGQHELERAPGRLHRRASRLAGEESLRQGHGLAGGSGQPPSGKAAAGEEDEDGVRFHEGQDEEERQGHDAEAEELARGPGADRLHQAALSGRAWKREGATTAAISERRK
jgi:hypothetical protein